MDFSQFENPLPYPSNSDLRINIKTATSEIDKLPLTRDQYQIEVAKAKDRCEDEHKSKIDAYYKKERELIDLFWQTVRSEHGYGAMTPDQISAIESKAWEEGHSSGFAEVDNCLYDIVEFARKFV